MFRIEIITLILNIKFEILKNMTSFSNIIIKKLFFLIKLSLQNIQTAKKKQLTYKKYTFKLTFHILVNGLRLKPLPFSF